MKRKLAAILAADVVGYSGLMSEDEAGTLSALREHRCTLFEPETQRHGGRIVKLMGDGALVEFGSVVDAVECALRIQHALADTDGPIRLRMGINLGDVIVDGDDLYGDGVNLAARLQQAAVPGGLCLSDAAFQQVRRKIGVDFIDGGEVSLKNIANPMRVWYWSPYANILPGLAGVSEPVPGFSGRPAIAVLAFDNLSPDREQEYLADGIAEDILTRLGMWRWLPVIARNSSFSLKGRTADLKRVGLELGARYLLEGSVRRAGDRIRITAQLTDSDTGHQVWASRYDRAVGEIFALQDEITDALVAALEPAVGRAEMLRAQRKTPSNLDAWGLYQRGMSELTKATRESLRLARGLFEQAAQRDRGFAAPLAAIAVTNFIDNTLAFTINAADLMKEAREVALRAVSLDDIDPLAHAALAYSSFSNRDYETAIAAGRRAVELNPSFALGHHALGASLFVHGEPEKSVESARTALRISPNDPWLFMFLGLLSAGLYMQRDYDGAAEAAGLGVQRFPWYASTLRWQAVALAQLGRIEEAHTILARFIERAPDYNLSAAERSYAFRRQNDLDHYLEGLRKAGLIE